ncbi:MAG: hypothetical protein V1790_17405 [Planctomycetota bacterium]
MPDKVWVRLPRAVHSDLPWSDLSAPPGVYLAESNPYGALSVRCADGELLGIKPDEFERLDMPAETEAT